MILHVGAPDHRSADMWRRAGRERVSEPPIRLLGRQAIIGIGYRGRGTSRQLLMTGRRVFGCLLGQQQRKLVFRFVGGIRDVESIPLGFRGSVVFEGHVWNGRR